LEFIKKAKFDTQDVLFVVGGVLVVIGTAIHHPTTACIVAGSLILTTPMLQLLSSFLRGLRG